MNIQSMEVFSGTLDEYIEELCRELASENDKEFLKRAWGSNFSVYLKRLEALGFCNLEHVLDAGCGYGQWAAALSTLNRTVSGIDIDESRVDICKKLSNYNGYTNIDFQAGTIEDTRFEAGQLDGIFSYSVIYNTDYKKYLAEFCRILKQDGLLYFSTNGLGWYLDSLLNDMNSNQDFSSLESSIQAIDNSLNFYAKGECVFGLPLIMKSDIVRDELEDIGFEIIAIGPDASINKDIHGCPSFFKESFKGHEYVWEVLCRKI